jgi:hypothetical protein
MYSAAIFFVYECTFWADLYIFQLYLIALGSEEREINFREKDS